MVTVVDVGRPSSQKDTEDLAGNRWVSSVTQCTRYTPSPSMPRRWVTLRAHCWHRPRPVRLLVREPHKTKGCMRDTPSIDAAKLHRHESGHKLRP